MTSLPRLLDSKLLSSKLLDADEAEPDSSLSPFVVEPDVWAGLDKRISYY